MPFQSADIDDDRLIFAKEDNFQKRKELEQFDDPWRLLIVDDEEEVHEITRITLRDYRFENRRIEILSAYCQNDVISIFERYSDIALVLLDVVMEKEDTGLHIVEYIRKTINNSSVRIVLRTGQPGKAPEQEVILKYDINDYKTKPEFTAQKLFTTLTACLRAYNSLIIIEKNTKGLEKVIRSSAEVFKTQSLSEFGKNVVTHLFDILDLNIGLDVDCAYLIGMPNSNAILVAGSGFFKEKTGGLLHDVMPQFVIKNYKKYEKSGGESFSDNEYIGVFKTVEGFRSALYLNRWDRLSEIEKKMIRIYANNIAIGFENLSLSREIINTQKEVILTLGEIVETRSQETANHVTRVAECCYLLAKKMGMDEKTCELLRLATPMHDVGKIGVPEAILNKPGPLTDQEFQIMKNHAQTGYEILKKSNRPIMKAAAIVALQHHERWDGSGYPQGLLGEKIHIYGRIAAIADVFDALTHKRCYKSAWSLNQVIDYFSNDSGKTFDKSLTDIFLKNIREFEGINKRFPE